MLSDFFGASDKIIERLQATVPELVKVGSTSGPATFEDEKKTPSAWVVYDGYDVSSDSKRVFPTLIMQRWVVGLVVISPNDKYGDKARNNAGVILPKIITALHGWKPEGINAASPMMMISAPGEVMAGGHTIYFIRFKLGVVN